MTIRVGTVPTIGGNSSLASHMIVARIWLRDVHPVPTAAQLPLAGGSAPRYRMSAIATVANFLWSNLHLLLLTKASNHTIMFGELRWLGLSVVVLSVATAAPECPEQTSHSPRPAPRQWAPCLSANLRKPRRPAGHITPTIASAPLPPVVVNTIAVFDWNQNPSLQKVCKIGQDKCNRWDHVWDDLPHAEMKSAGRTVRDIFLSTEWEPQHRDGLPKTGAWNQCEIDLCHGIFGTKISAGYTLPAPITTYFGYWLGAEIDKPRTNTSSGARTISVCSGFFDLCPEPVTKISRDGSWKGVPSRYFGAKYAVAQVDLALVPRPSLWKTIPMLRFPFGREKYVTDTMDSGSNQTQRWYSLSDPAGCDCQDTAVGLLNIHGAVCWVLATSKEHEESVGKMLHMHHRQEQIRVEGSVGLRKFAADAWAPYPLLGGGGRWLWWHGAHCRGAGRGECDVCWTELCDHVLTAQQELLTEQVSNPPLLEFNLMVPAPLEAFGRDLGPSFFLNFSRGPDHTRTSGLPRQCPAGSTLITFSLNQAPLIGDLIELFTEVTLKKVQSSSKQWQSGQDREQQQGQ
ncbi:hypothetical protein B0H17DRAFT_1150844 [Mycena rosella]|uniref:Uncharacterized protein n=1 Tax=Mycena rosella TaxID=1033263 RepID=A0AAD7BQF4_MYCRO|nr:hypothetical protein B0H17DRAFT_1150844 [Mycena rosella]